MISFLRFCPKCRLGDKPTVMKPKAQFLKELEKFNKEKNNQTFGSSSGGVISRCFSAINFKNEVKRSAPVRRIRCRHMYSNRYLLMYTIGNNISYSKLKNYLTTPARRLHCVARCA